MSDHAVIRWLERVHQIDVDKIRREILSPELQAAIACFPNGKFPIGNGCKAVVRDSCVVSIVRKRKRETV